MAPEEMAGPRYRGLGMSRCAYRWGLKRENQQRKSALMRVCVYPAASLLTQQEVLPQRRVAQDLNNIQRVEVGHKQVRFSIG